MSEQPQGGRPHAHLSLLHGILADVLEASGSKAASCRGAQRLGLQWDAIVLRTYLIQESAELRGIQHRVREVKVTLWCGPQLRPQDAQGT